MGDLKSVISLLLFLPLVYTFYKYLFIRKSCSKRLPPSPRSVPIIGHLHLIQDPLHTTLQKLSQKYGHVMFLKFGARKVVVVSSPEAVEECFTKNDIIFANRPQNLVSKTFSRYDPIPFSMASYGDHWRNTRRLINVELLSANRLSALRYIRQEEVNYLLEYLVKNSTPDLMIPRKMELKSLFVDLSFNIITRMIAGKRYYGSDAISEEAKSFREMIGQVVEVFGTSNLEDNLPILEWIGINGLKKKMLMQMNKMDDFFQKIVDECRLNRLETAESSVFVTSLDPDDDGSDGEKRTTTLIDVMLSLQHTDESIKSVMMTLLLAGTETPATTLEWAMTLLFNNPETMKKLRDEIQSCVGNERMLDENDLPRLTYLHNVITETLRLCSPVPLLVPHESSDDCKICGFDIPKGTMLLVNTWAIHRDPKHWKDPNKFKPERFDNVEKNEGYELIPFGMGRRACPGINMGRKVLGLALGSMIQCFDWERDGDELLDMTEVTGLTIRKRLPLEAIYAPRPVIIDYFSCN